MNETELADLRLAFRVAGTIAPRTGLLLPCWLAQFDERRRPCTGRIEAFHFLGRQRVRNALGALLPEPWPREVGGETAQLLTLAEWDPRNAGPGCVGHHRRLDSHATPGLVVPGAALPARVHAYAEDWGLESALERKYPVEP